MERELISRAMLQAKNVKARAAKLLGISRARLLRRLGQLDINEELPPDAFHEQDETIDSSAFEEAGE